MEIDKEVSAHEQLHLRPVTCVDLSADGELIVTGMRRHLWSSHSPQEVQIAQFVCGGSRNLRIRNHFGIRFVSTLV